MQTVVVTGLGIVSSLGATLSDVVAALRGGRSGLVVAPELEAAGLPCTVFGAVWGFDENKVKVRPRRTMSHAALYAASASIDALADAGLDVAQLDPGRTAVVIGGEHGGLGEATYLHGLIADRKKSRIRPTTLPKMMSSTASGNVAALLGLQGRVLSAATGAASGLDSIALGRELVQFGLADVVLCGASEEECWRELGPSIARWGGFPTGYHDRPAEACRPFDADRQGTVLSAGAGILVLESLDRAQARGARPYAEIVTHGAAHDGCNPFRPTGQGLRRALRQVLQEAKRQGMESIDYVSSGATGTRWGDQVEAEALGSELGQEPPVSSTTGLTGYALGASSALQTILTLLMMSESFVAPTANLETIAPECAMVHHVRELTHTALASAICTSSGLGGFNSVIVLRKL